MYTQEILYLLAIAVALIIASTMKRKCNYCGRKQWITGKGFSKVMCKKCADKGGRS